MKKFTLSLIITTLSAVSSMAQQGYLSTSLPKPPTYNQNGIYAGVAYMNLTDAKVKSEFKGDGYTENYSGQSGMHLGLAGFSVGFNQTPENGFGFRAGAKLVEAFNSSERGESKPYFLIPEVNLALAFNRYLVAFGGLNAAVITGDSSYNDYRTQAGIQFGLGLRATKNLAINAGYTILRQKLTQKYSFGTSEDEFQFAGFASDVTYTF